MPAPTKHIKAFLVVIVVFISPIAGSIAANELLKFAREIDPDGAFMWGIIHHIVQAVLPIILLIMYKRQELGSWVLNKGQKSIGLKWIVYFSGVWVGIYAILTTINLLQDFQPTAYYNTSDLRNFLGEAFFRIFIVGPSEEFLFRVFPILFLLSDYPKRTDLLGTEIPIVAFPITFIFSLSHIGVDWFNLEIVHFDPVQLFTSYGFGLFYTWLWFKSKSIIYPIIIHAISDLIPFLSLFILNFLSSH